MMYVFITICLVAVAGIAYAVLKKNPKVVEELKSEIPKKVK